MMTAHALALDSCEEVTAAAEDRRFQLDEAEFRAFYERTVGSLRGYVVRSCGDDALADDMVQEAYYRLLRSTFEVESERHRKNYLFRIATNLLRDHYRRSKWKLLPLKDMPEERRRGDASDLRQDLRQALLRLKPRERQLLWLAHVEGLRHREIAGVMGIREGSARLLAFRARRKLAGLLEESGIGPEVLS